MLSITDAWWRQVNADVHSAEVLLPAGQFYAVSFFAQQAAEKALKALLIERSGGQQPPRTHDLLFLGRLAVVPAGLHTHLAALFPVFDLARYPVGGRAPIDAFAESDAKRHLASARRVVTWVARQL